MALPTAQASNAVSPPDLPRVTIVLVNYRGLEDTRKCLRSLEELDYPSDQLRILLVDNDPAASDIAALEGEFQHIDYIQSPENSGWAGGNNLGIALALDTNADYVLLLNNDTVVRPAIVRRLVDAMAAAPEYGIAGVTAFFMDEPETVMTDGCVFIDPQGRGFFIRQPIELADASLPPRLVPTELVNGCCMMIRNDVFHKIGMIDERFFLIHEESEFCLRANQAGFRCGVLAERLLWHKGSSAFARESKPLQRYFDARNLYLILNTHKRLFHASLWSFRPYLNYLRHTYSMYSKERACHNTASSDAVLVGICDALSKRFGPWKDRRRPLLPLLRILFTLRYKLSG